MISGFIATPAHAAAVVWDGSVGDGLWASGANWSNNTGPGATNDVSFDTDGAVAPYSITLGADRSIKTITFGSSTLSQGYTFNGNNLTIVGAGGIVNNDADTQTFNSTVTVGISQVWDAAAGGLTFSAVNLTDGTARTLTVQGAFNTSIAGVIQNNGAVGSLTKTGTGTLTLSGTNTYTGVTTINGGTLSVATIGNGGVAGNLGQATNAAGNLVLGGGTLQYTGANSSTNRNFTLTTGTTSTIEVTANNLTLNGASTATTGALTKTGAGTLTLGGTNLYTGTTTVTAGTLAYGINNALATGAVTVSGGTLDIGTFSDSVGAVTLSSGNITGTTGVLSGSSYVMQSGDVSAILGGTGGLSKTTAGTVTLSGLNTYTGATTVSAGTLSVSNLGNGGVASGIGASTNAATNLVLAGGTLQYTGANTSTNRNFTLSTGTTSTIDVTANNLTLNGASTATTGGLTKIGAGTLTLGGANLYTGTTTVNAGTLAYGTNNALASGAVTVNGGTLDIGAFSDTVGAITLASGNITGTTGVLSGTSYAVQSGTVSAILGGTGALTKSTAGTVTLAKANTYSGLTTVSAGTLALGINDAIGTGGVTVSGGTLDIGTFTDSVGAVSLTSGSIVGTTGVLSGSSYDMQAGNVSAILGGAGALTKTTAGTVTLSGLNTYTGATTINAGTLSVSNLGNGGVASGIGASTNAAANLVLGGGTLQYTGADTSTDRNFTLTTGTTSTIDVTNNLTISGASTNTTGGLTKTGAGTLTLSGQNQYTGTTTVNAGTLAYGTSNALASGAVTVSGGTLDIGTYSDTVGAITLSSGNISGTTGTLTGTSYGLQSGTISAILGGTGAVTKTTSGTVTLTGLNTYTGATNINAGTFSVSNIGNGGSASGLGASSNAAANLVLGGGTLQYTGANTSTNRSFTLTAGTTSTFDVTTGNLTISGASTNTTGALTKIGAGTLTLGGANLYTGTTTVSGGTLAYGVNNALSSGAVNVNGGTLDIGAYTDTVGAVTLTSGSITGSTGTLTGASYALSAGDISANLAGSGITLTKSTSGTASLGGSNTYTGITSVTGGVLLLNSANALPGGIGSTGGTSGLTLNGGVIGLGAGDFTRGTGTGVTQVRFSGNGGFAAYGADRTVNLGGSATPSLVTWNAGNFVLSGNSFILGASDADKTVTFANPIALGNAARTFQADNGSAAIDGILSGVLSGTGGGVTKTGTGTLQLTGTNTYTGVTTINAGTLSVGTIGNGGIAGNLGQATNAATNLVLGGGTLQYTGANSSTNRNFTLTAGTTSTIEVTTNNLTLSGASTATTGGLTKTGAGTLTLTGTNLYTGATTVNAGTLSVGTIGNGGASSNIGASNSSASNLVLGGGTLQYTGANASTNRAFTLTSGTTSTIDTANNLTISGGTAASTGSLIKAGNGTLTLSGASQFTGSTTVSVGTLNLQNNSALTGSAGTTVANGATLALQGGYSVGNGTLSLQGTGLSNVGALTNVSGNNTWTGDLSLLNSATVTTQAGTLTIGSAAPSFTISGHTQPTESGYVTIGGQTLTLSGNGTAIVINDRIRDFAGQTAGTSFTNPTTVNYAPETSSPGNVVINMGNGGSVTYAANANSYTGSTTVQNGTLILATKSNIAAPHETNTDSFHAINGSLIIGNGDSTAATVQFGTGGAANEFLAIGTDVTLYKDGTLNLNNQSQTINQLTFNGGTVNLGSGTLYLNNDVTVNASAGNTAFINGATGALSMTLNRSGSDTGPDATRTFNVIGGAGNTVDLSIGGVVQSGNLVKTGNGTMVLTNTNSYTGTTSVAGGILNIQQGSDVNFDSALGAGNGSTAQGTSVSSGATLQLQGGIAVTKEKLTLSGNGYNPGTGVLGALNNLSGNNTIGAGANTTLISLGADARINSSAGTLTLATNIASSGNNALTIGGTGDTTISGKIITGSGTSTSLTKDGTGTLILSGDNTYQGATNITQGVVRVQSNTGLGATTTGTDATFVTSGAELQFTGGLAIAGEAVNLNGAGIGGTSGALNNYSGSNSLAGLVTLQTASTIKSTAGTLTLSGGISSTDAALNVTGSGDLTVSGAIDLGTGSVTKTGSGVFTFAGANTNGTTGTTGNVSLQAGSMVVGNGAQVTTLNSGKFSSVASTTLTIATGGKVVADYDTGVTFISGALAGTGTFQKTGAGTLAFDNSFTASGLTLTLSGGTLSLGKNSLGSLVATGITVGTIHITGNTILDFNNSAGTFLSSANVVIDAGVTVTVNNWVSVANNAAQSTIWYATSTLNSGTLGGTNQVGGTPLGTGAAGSPGTVFTGYTPGLTPTWVAGSNANGEGWFDHEIRPTPEPSTYGAIFLSGCLGLLGWRRWRQRKSAVAQGAIENASV